MINHHLQAMNNEFSVHLTKLISKRTIISFFRCFYFPWCDSFIFFVKWKNLGTSDVQITCVCDCLGGGVRGHMWGKFVYWLKILSSKNNKYTFRFSFRLYLKLKVPLKNHAIIISLQNKILIQISVPMKCSATNIQYI